ncbi:hypothetical protein LCM23_25205 [Cytobacillus kochii]|uniref:hypothetical protein n=1 Tax=Cytobacillus kochii TaxID=859143 RepID=UPI001CD269E6|nr:hypothetical protein [Cytobacillus kochii]MCA1029314.1 hypothetical protein [Cytobacillus kochii]
MTNINYEDVPNTINDLNAACDDVECEVASLQEKNEKISKYNAEIEEQLHEMVVHCRMLESQNEKLKEENETHIKQKNEIGIENMYLRNLLKRWA